MTNWDAVKTGSLDALMAAIMERMSDQRDDPSSREQEYADTSLSLIERCKAAERALAESEARRAEAREGLEAQTRNFLAATDATRAALQRAEVAERIVAEMREGPHADCPHKPARIAAERSLAAAVEVLREVEWSATGAVSGVGCCPDCGGYNPAQRGTEFWHEGYHGNRAGHAPGCALASVLGGGR